jgi:hypothetical protein
VLNALELFDFAIADHVTVELGAGLNVLTGETGAGKSLLVDALALLAGGRADAGLVRAGRDSALVQAAFAAAPAIDRRGPGDPGPRRSTGPRPSWWRAGWCARAATSPGSTARS